MRAGQFREDLYFRLAVVRAAVPPLRKRKEDIPLLVRNFLRELKRDDFEIGPDVLSQLMAHDWPGNVRELRNVVERGLSLEGGALPIEVSGDVGDRDQRRRAATTRAACRRTCSSCRSRRPRGCSSSRSSAST